MLDKELRILSRRKRTYWLRSLYPVLLIVIVFGAWSTMRVAARGTNISQGLSGMDQMARSVVSAMVWMQFLLSQFMAVVLVSNAMSEEVRRQSLSALMTTPMRSGQILFGKLMGPLMMVWTLLALSCPFLALVRVWGGIPWDYLVSTLTVTLCVIICLAVLSQFLALWIERPHKIVLLLLSLMIIGYVSGFLLVRLGQLSRGMLLVVNPWAVFTALSMGFSRAGAAVRAPWQIHCLLMLGIASVFFLASLFCLRRRALTGPRSSKSKFSLAALMTRLIGRGRGHAGKAIRQVTGAPLLWKELGYAPRQYLKRQVPWIILLAGVLVACRVGPAFIAGRRGPAAGIGMALYSMAAAGISLFVTLRTATMAAWCVAQEKEARSWSVLLCTPLPDNLILRHKALCVILRNAAGWIALVLGNLVSILLLFYEDDTAGSFMTTFFTLSSLIGTVASMFMVTGVGLYFSIRMRTGALALTSTLGFLIAFQVGARFLMFPMIYMLGPLSRTPYVYMIFNSVFYVLVGTLMFRMCGRGLRKYVF